MMLVLSLAKVVWLSGRISVGVDQGGIAQGWPTAACAAWGRASAENANRWFEVSLVIQTSTVASVSWADGKQMLLRFADMDSGSWFWLLFQ